MKVKQETTKAWTFWIPAVMVTIYPINLVYYKYSALTGKSLDAEIVVESTPKNLYA
jgi:hypothetical protein